MKLFLAIIIFVMLFPCGKRSLVNASDLVVPQGFDVETNFDSFEIKKLNGKLGWNKEISSKLFADLSDETVQDLINHPIHQDDLKLLDCTNFNQLALDQKKAFYIVFLAAIAERESDFNPTEATYDYFHQNWNIGLLQIDLNSAHIHAKENVPNLLSRSNLEDPVQNLKIGTYILKNQITGLKSNSLTGHLFTNRSYYWDVLTENFQNRIIKSFKNNAKNLPFCSKAES